MSWDKTSISTPTTKTIFASHCGMRRAHPHKQLHNPFDENEKGSFRKRTKTLHYQKQATSEFTRGKQTILQILVFEIFAHLPPCFSKTRSAVPNSGAAEIAPLLGIHSIRIVCHFISIQQLIVQRLDGSVSKHRDNE